MSRDRVLGQRLNTILGLVAVILLALTGTAHAITFDAFADFSSSTNGAPSPWSYGSGVTGTSFTPYTTFSSACFTAFGVSGLGCWHTGDEAHPAVGINTISGTNTSGTIIVPPGVLNVHPGPSDDSIVQWTAPVAATYSILVSFAILDIAPTGTVALVVLNGTNNLFSSPLTGPGATGGSPGQTVPFGLTLPLAAGDVLAFGVNNAGSAFNDSTGLIATLVAPDVVPEPIPEPATLLLFGTTAAGLGLARWRQRRRQEQQT